MAGPCNLASGCSPSGRVATPASAAATSRQQLIRPAQQQQQQPWRPPGPRSSSRSAFSGPRREFSNCFLTLEFTEYMPRFWNTITREEMSRLTGNYSSLKSSSTTQRATIRTYPNGSRTSLAEMNGKSHHHYHHQQQQQPRYASTISLRSLGSETGNGWGLGHSSASLVDLQDQTELERVARRRSPSLPPIIRARDEYRYQEPEPSRSRQSRQPQQTTRSRARGPRPRHKEPDTGDEDYEDEGPEGETSGYASDDVPAIRQLQQRQLLQQQTVVLPAHVNCNKADGTMGEKTWQNPYYSDENSSPSSRKLANLKAGEFNRQRWGSVWGQDVSKDPPPPSWLERGLSRLDHSSQVLVINHDSASSPDSSTTGSLGSDPNKTYLRGQNLPIDADVLQEREIRRQKALELQNAIKQQLEEREKKRKEEREKKLREERAEEERIKRERDLEKQRLEEEQRRQREKEAAKQKKSKAMQELLEAAERQAKEERRQQLQQHRRRRDDENEESKSPESMAKSSVDGPRPAVDKETKQAANRRESMDTLENSVSEASADPVRLPVSQEVAIVLSARIEDPELLSKSPLKLVNLVVTPSSRHRTASREGSSGSSGNSQANDIGASLSALLAGGFGSPVVLRTASPRITENRLLTPSKYRMAGGRDCGTQTDCEAELTDYMDKFEETRIKDTKERKDAANNSRRDVEKSTNTGTVDEATTKSLGRGKPSQQARPSLESRPRWNANRPGTRYRTQSEKDPHYQRRMRLRRRQVETSDEGSSDFRRSPSPGRRKHGVTKAKSRNSMARRKSKLDCYDADTSMDSLSSLVPLHTDKNGRVNVERPEDLAMLRARSEAPAGDAWAGQEILTQLTSLRNGLIMKKREWDLQECPITPITELY